MKFFFTNICQKSINFGDQMHINERKNFLSFHEFQTSFTIMVTLYLKKGSMKDFNFWLKYSHLMYILRYW